MIVLGIFFSENMSVDVYFIKGLFWVTQTVI